MTTVGIDLGTSRVRAAVVVGTTPQVIQFGDGSHFLPAVVAVDKGTKHVGHTAIARAAMNPQNAVLGVKRFLGRPASDELAMQIASRSGVAVAPREDGGIAFQIGKETLTPEDIAGALLAQVVDMVTKTTGAPPDAAMLTTPYWFGPSQRQALKVAAQQAGLRALQVMSDGTAIALSLATAELEQRCSAIVDVGAGGCSVSILELGPERVALLANAGARDGGGDDMDHEIVRAMIKGLRDKYGEFPVYPAISELIRQVCPDLKRDLLSVETAQATIPFLPIGPGVSMQQVILQRRHLQALMVPSLERLRTACAEALKAASLAPENLDAVYVTGGLSQVPLLRETVASVLGQVTSRQLDIDGAVAIGASLQSAMMDGRVDPIPTIDVVTSTSMPPPAPVQRGTMPPADVRSIRPSVRTSSAPPRGRTTTPPPFAAVRPVTPVPKASSAAPPNRRTPRPSSRPPAPSAPPRKPSGAFAAQGRSQSGSFAIPQQEEVQIAYRDAVPDVPVETLRMELATLLASVRGGALTEGAKATKRGVARTSPEAVLADEAPAEAREEIAEKLGQICGQLHRGMQAIRQYTWGHPHTESYFERVHNLLQEFHAVWPTSVRFELGTTSFAYDRTVVWRPDRPPFDTVPYQLFIDGLRVLQLKPGIEPAELREFAAVLVRDVGGVLVSDDDAVTALWDRRLPHVGYIAVDAYLDTDDPDFEKDLEALEKEIGALCNFDDVDGMSARLDAQREDADQAVALALPKDVRELLSSGVAMTEDEWVEAYAGLFPEVLAESEEVGDENVLLDGLDAFAKDVVSSSQGAVAFTVLDLLSRSVLETFGPEKSREFESQACGAMFPASRLSQVVQDFARMPPDAETLRLFSLVLTALPDDRFFEGAQEFFWTSSEATEGALLDYMVRFASGREAAFEPVLARGSPTLAMAALRGLSSLGTDEARGVLIKAFDNPHLEVKVSAIGFLPDAAAETVRSEVTRLLEDPSSEVRLSTLNVLSHLGSTAVGPVLVRRIQNVDLTTLSAQERKLLLDTLVKLSPRRGSEIAIEILNATQMIPTQGPEETRAIAAEVLASVDSEAVEQALERAARKRWSNSAPVREAAARSLETLRSQRFLQKGTPR